MTNFYTSPRLADMVQPCWLVITCLACCLLSGVRQAHGTEPENVTVLIYHKFGEEQYPTTNVSLERFAGQMAYLQENDYQVLPLARMVKLLHSGKPLPDKAVVITIDDGYESVYTGAWPILRKHGYPFTVFLYTKAVEHDYHNFLTWKQVREMWQAGVDFEDHSFSHFRLGTRPGGLDDKGYAAWIRADLEKSRAVLDRRLGATPRFLALPYGEYNSVIEEQCKQLGYEAVFSQDPGSVSRDTGYIIPREPVLGLDWSTMAHFIMVLRRVDLPLVDIEPGIDPFVNTKPARFCASLLYPQRYQPGSFSMYVSELGWQRPDIDGNRLCITNDLELKRRSNRVAVSAREKGSGRSAVRFWLLINPDSPVPKD